MNAIYKEITTKEDPIVLQLDEEDEGDGTAKKEGRYWTLQPRILNTALQQDECINEDIIRLQLHLLQDYIKDPSTTLQPTKYFIADSYVTSILMMKPWSESRRLFTNYSHHNLPWKSKASNPIPLDNEWIFIPFLHAFHWSLIARHRYQQNESFHYHFYHLDSQPSTDNKTTIQRRLQETTFWNDEKTVNGRISWTSITCTQQKGLVCGHRTCSNLDTFLRYLDLSTECNQQIYRIVYFWNMIQIIMVSNLPNGSTNVLVN